MIRFSAPLTGKAAPRFAALLIATLISALFSSSSARAEESKEESSPDLPLRVMSFNIRFDTPKDGINAWPHRKDLAAAAIRDNRVDLAGLQEALSSQLADLHEALPNYGQVGVGRDDGKDAGEHSSILYNRDRFTVIKSGTFWLSETPETPGKLGWDAVCPRVATWGIFEERKTKSRVLFLNTHLDHKGERARLEGTRLIARRIAALEENLPTIVTGDFNGLEDSPPIQLLLADAKLGLRLAREKRSEAEIGGRTTFTGFKPGETGEVIDFIFVNAGVKVVDYRFLHLSKGDVLVSDHWPVLSTVRLRPVF